MEEAKIKELIKKYSEFINFPIYLRTWREMEKVVDDGSNEEAEDDDDNKDEVEVKDDDDED